MKELVPVGIVLVLVGFILITISTLFEAKTELAVGGFFGFMPFGFATSKRMLYVLIGLMAFVFVAWFVLSKMN